MNAETMMVDPNELVIDMPLDEANVNTKVESMRNNGMIQDVTVWLQDMRIIDGFHRTEAARRLGLKAIRCKVVDCSEAAFWDARIQSARQHHTIEGERLQVWIRECWRNSDWPDVIAVMKDGQIRASNPAVIDIFATHRKERCLIVPSNRFERWLVEDCGLKYWYELGNLSDDDLRKLKGLGTARRSELRKRQKLAESLMSLDNTNPLSTLYLDGEWTSDDEALTVAIFLASSMSDTKDELSASLSAWFKTKAAQWGITPDWLVQSVLTELVDGRIVKAGCDLLHGVIDNFTIGDATAIAESLPVNPYYVSTDSETEMRSYLRNRREGEAYEHYKNRRRDEDYLERKRKVAETRLQEIRERTPAEMEAIMREKAKQNRQSFRWHLVNATNSVKACGDVLADNPEAPAMIAEFAQFVADFAAEHFPDVQVAKPNPVALENSRLRAENAKLKERIASLERALGSKQAAGEMLSNAMAWSSGDLER